MKRTIPVSSFTPTDYSNPANWFMNEFASPEKADAEVDVIFFNGTSILKSDQENGVGNISEETRLRYNVPYESTISAFDDGTRMFIPLYRQIAGEICLFFPNHEDLLEHMRDSEVATDIFASLDYYFENYNNGRPFIISGISQGGAAVQIALEGYFGDMANRQLLDRMVAAYSIAYGIDKNWFDGLDYLKFASGPYDTGVVISWVTEGPGATEKDFLLPDGNPADSLVINPINWKTDSTYASASECLGSFVDGQVVSPGIYNLQFNPERGCLVCDNNTNYVRAPFADGPLLWGGKSLHEYEVSQAYASIRQNMHDRIDAYLAQHPLESEQAE